MIGVTHKPSGRYARILRQPANPRERVPLSPGLVRIETRHFEIRAVIAVPVGEIETGATAAPCET